MAVRNPRDPRGILALLLVAAVAVFIFAVIIYGKELHLVVDDMNSATETIAMLMPPW